MAPHECDKEQVIEMMKNATDKIFNKLDDMSAVLQSVAVQKRELEFMTEKLARIEAEGSSREERLTAMEQTCAARHFHTGQPLAVQVRNAMIIGMATTAAIAVMSLVAYVAYVHLSGWTDYSRTQINGVPAANKGH